MTKKKNRKTDQFEKSEIIFKRKRRNQKVNILLT
jgi:hypothetical protein